VSVAIIFTFDYKNHAIEKSMTFKLQTDTGLWQRCNLILIDNKVDPFIIGQKILNV